MSRWIINEIAQYNKDFREMELVWEADGVKLKLKIILADDGYIALRQNKETLYETKPSNLLQS